jgi:sulfonate transport system substrate-binding protein
VRLTWGFGGLPLIAKERGEFAKALAKDNIRIEWIGPFPNHAPSIQAVVGGSADFSFGGSTTPALAAIPAGSPLVFSLFAVVQPRTTAIIARDGSGINSVSDLVGKTVAVNRSGLGEFILVAELETFHVERSKVKVVYLNPPEAAPAFGSRQIDAWAMWSPGVDLARSQYKGHDVFLEGRDLDFQIDFNSWLVRKEFAERNRDLVAAVNAAFTAEAEWASTHSSEAEKFPRFRVIRRCDPRYVHLLKAPVSRSSHRRSGLCGTTATRRRLALGSQSAAANRASSGPSGFSLIPAAAAGTVHSGGLGISGDRVEQFADQRA